MLATYDPIDVRIELFKAQLEQFDFNKKIDAFEALTYMIGALQPDF